MNKEKLINKINEELAHIPRGEIQQNTFRAIYNDYRRNDLSKDSITSPTHTLKTAIDHMKKKYPEFVPDYDKDFFV